DRRTAGWWATVARPRSGERRAVPSGVAPQQGGLGMKHLTRKKRLSLILGPLVALVLVLNALGTGSFAGLVSAATGSSTCPSDGTAVTALSLRITRGSSTINATSFAGVQQGDHVKVTFDLDDRCTSGTTQISP